MNKESLKLKDRKLVYEYILDILSNHKQHAKYNVIIFSFCSCIDSYYGILNMQREDGIYYHIEDFPELMKYKKMKVFYDYNSNKCKDDTQFWFKSNSVAPRLKIIKEILNNLN